MNRKLCNKCGFEKDLSEFAVYNRSKDGRQSACRLCHRELDKKLYDTSETRRNAIKHNGDKHRHIARQYVFEYLLANPCIDCGEQDPIVLEFDHVKGTKVESVSQMVANGCGLAKISKEIEKCVIRCANCHRRKTAEQFGFWVLDLIRDVA